MIMQNGISGVPFGGTDIPGFYGEVSENMWVRFYQIGIYYPFMRAHAHRDFQNREPWI